MNQSERKCYEMGYRRGYSGQPMVESFAEKSPHYATGWDHGNCDRPSLEELMPIDIDHEASDACLS